MKGCLFNSGGLPEALTGFDQWAGWQRGAAMPRSLTGRAFPHPFALALDPRTWCSFRQALTAFRDRGFDGLAFITSPDQGPPVRFLTLHDAADGRRLSPSARETVRACGTYAELDPEARDVTLAVALPMRLTEQLGVRGTLDPGLLPPSFPVADYDGDVTVWPALFGMPLTGETVCGQDQIRDLDPFA